MRPNLAVQRQGDNLILSVKVQTNAKKNAILSLQNKQVRIAVNASPVEGRANAALINFLAQECGVRKTAVSILSGAKSRNKLLCIVSPKRIPPVLATNSIS